MMFLFVLLVASTHAMKSDISSVPRFPTYDTTHDLHILVPKSTSNVQVISVEKNIDGDATFYSERSSQQLIMEVSQQNLTLQSTIFEAQREEKCKSLCERFMFNITSQCRNTNGNELPNYTTKPTCENTGRVWKLTCFDTNDAITDDNLCKFMKKGTCLDALERRQNTINCTSNGICIKNHLQCDGNICDTVNSEALDRTETNCSGSDSTYTYTWYPNRLLESCVSTITGQELADAQCINVLRGACFDGDDYRSEILTESACEKTGNIWSEECSGGDYGTEQLCDFKTSIDTSSSEMFLDIDETSTVDINDLYEVINPPQTYETKNFAYSVLPASPQESFIVKWTNAYYDSVYLIAYDDDEFEYVYENNACSSTFARLKGKDVFIMQGENIRFHQDYDAAAYEYFSEHHSKFQETIQRVRSISHWNNLGIRHDFADHRLYFEVNTTKFTVDDEPPSENFLCKDFCKFGCTAKYKKFGVLGSPTVRTGIVEDPNLTPELGEIILKNAELKEALIADTEKPITLAGPLSTQSNCGDILHQQNTVKTKTHIQGDKNNGGIIIFNCNNENKVYTFENVVMENVQLNVTGFSGTIEFKNSHFEFKKSGPAIIGPVSLSLSGGTYFRANFYDPDNEDQIHINRLDVQSEAQALLTARDDVDGITDITKYVDESLSNIVAKTIVIENGMLLIGAPTFKATSMKIQNGYFDALNIANPPQVIVDEAFSIDGFADSPTASDFFKNDFFNFDTQDNSNIRFNDNFDIEANNMSIYGFEDKRQRNIGFTGSGNVEMRNVEGYILQISGFSVKLDNVLATNNLDINAASTTLLDNIRSEHLNLDCLDHSISNLKFNSLTMECSTEQNLDIQTAEKYSSDGYKKISLKNINAVISTVGNLAFNTIDLEHAKLFLFGETRPWTHQLTFKETSVPYSSIYLGYQVKLMDVKNPLIKTEFSDSNVFEHTYLTPANSEFTRIAIPSIQVQNTGSSSSMALISPKVTFKSISAMNNLDVEYIEIQDFINLDFGDKRQYCEPGYQTTDNGCQACVTGKYSSTFGSSECEPCPVGLYNDETGQRACKQCPKINNQLRITLKEGSSLETDCRLTSYCSSGFYFYDKGCHNVPKCGTSISDMERFMKRIKCKCGNSIADHDQYCIYKSSGEAVETDIKEHPLCSSVAQQAPCIKNDNTMKQDVSVSKLQLQTGCPPPDQPLIGNPKSKLFNLNILDVINGEFICDCGSEKCVTGEFCHDDGKCRTIPKCKNNALTDERCLCASTECPSGNVCVDGVCQPSCDNVKSETQEIDETVKKLVKPAVNHIGRIVNIWTKLYENHYDLYKEKFEDSELFSNKQIWDNTEKNIDSPLHAFNYQMEDIILSRLRREFNEYIDQVTDTAGSNTCQNGICIDRKNQFRLTRDVFAIYEKGSTVDSLNSPFQQLFPRSVPMYRNVGMKCCLMRETFADEFDCDSSTENICLSYKDYEWQKAYVKTTDVLSNPLHASWNRHNVPNIERDVPSFSDGKTMEKGEYVHTVWFAYLDNLKAYLESIIIANRPHVTEKCLCHTDSFEKIQACSTAQYCQHGRCRFTPLDDCTYTKGMVVNQNECICGNTSCDSNTYCIKAQSTCLEDSIDKIQ